MTYTFHRSIPVSMVRRFLAVPDLLVQKFAGDPIEIDGRTLNRSVQLLLAGAQRSGRSVLEGNSVAERRKEMTMAAKVGMAKAKGLHVSDRVIPGPECPLRIRVYRPFGIEARPAAIVYYHGGGWVLGDLETHDATCRLLALSSGCVVISVGYRLAPEHPFPAPVDDALAAFQWVTAHADELSIDATAVAVMGDSAGGNLAAVVSQVAARWDGPAPIAQGLVYPSTDFHLDTRSVDILSEGFMLTRESMDWFREQYLAADQSKDDPLVSPLLADDVSGVAPAWVWTAGFDPLRDEGRAYAEKLEKAGVIVHHRCYDDMIHGFYSMGVLPGGIETAVEMGGQIGELIQSQRQL